MICSSSRSLEIYSPGLHDGWSEMLSVSAVSYDAETVCLGFHWSAFVLVYRYSCLNRVLGFTTTAGVCFHFSKWILRYDLDRFPVEKANLFSGTVSPTDWVTFASRIHRYVLESIPTCEMFPVTQPLSKIDPPDV